VTSATSCTARLGQRLTVREAQILRGVANGQSNAEIGRELYLTENTVKSHLQRASRKLGATGRAHAVARAIRHGVLTLRDIQPAPRPNPTPARPPRAAQAPARQETAA
jgi:DNA-binding CsgD family transcriptional regulator